MKIKENTFENMEKKKMLNVKAEKQKNAFKVNNKGYVSAVPCRVGSYRVV